MDLTKCLNEVNINKDNERYYEGMLRMMKEENQKLEVEFIDLNDFYINLRHEEDLRCCFNFFFSKRIFAK